MSFFRHTIFKGLILMALMLFYIQIAGLTFRIFLSQGSEQTEGSWIMTFLLDGVSGIFSLSDGSPLFSALITLGFFVIQGILWRLILPIGWQSKTASTILCLFISYAWAVLSVRSGEAERIWPALALVSGVLVLYSLTKSPKTENKQPSGEKPKPEKKSSES